MRRPRLACTSLAALLALAALGSPARAERVRHAHEPRAAMAWGVTTGELATAGIFYLNFGTSTIPSGGPGFAFNFTPMVLAPGVAYLARNADPRPALAIHGAGWLGLDLFLIGTLIDGRAETHRMKVGPVALGLAGAGALVGGYYAWTHVDTRRDAGFALLAPGAGFAAGGLFLGGLYVLAGGLDGDKASSQFATGAVAGLSIGLAVATYVAHTERPPRVPLAAAAARLTPIVTPEVTGFALSTRF